MKEREREVPRVERVRLNQSQFLGEMERARKVWLARLETAIDNIRQIDQEKFNSQEAILSGQQVSFFREDVFDERGDLIGGRLFFEAKPKEDLGFRTKNERNFY